MTLFYLIGFLFLSTLGAFGVMFVLVPKTWRSIVVIWLGVVLMIQLSSLRYLVMTGGCTP